MVFFYNMKSPCYLTIRPGISGALEWFELIWIFVILHSVQDREYTLYTNGGVPVEMGHMMALPPGYRAKSGSNILGGRAPRGCHDAGSILTDTNELISLTRFDGTYVWAKKRPTLSS